MSAVTAKRGYQTPKAGPGIQYMKTCSVPFNHLAISATSVYFRDVPVLQRKPRFLSNVKKSPKGCKDLGP